MIFACVGRVQVEHHRVRVPILVRVDDSHVRESSYGSVDHGVPGVDGGVGQLVVEQRVVVSRTRPCFSAMIVGSGPRRSTST